MSLGTAPVRRALATVMGRGGQWAGRPGTSKGTLNAKREGALGFTLHPETYALLNVTQSRAWAQKEQDLPPEHAEPCCVKGIELVA